jgi:hypothetical protein
MPKILRKELRIQTAERTVVENERSVQYQVVCICKTHRKGLSWFSASLESLKPTWF